jgi:hypothetical protein
MKSERYVKHETERGRSEPILLAERDGLGKILYYNAEDIYELRLEMESYKASHFMTGKEWEEFINFSGQDERKEFFILLKEKYPQLTACLEDDKMRMDFLKFIEASYDGSQPLEEK